jgi:hypothetical protein
MTCFQSTGKICSNFTKEEAAKEKVGRGGCGEEERQG